MVIQHIYQQTEIPKDIHTQIVSFLRIVWPSGFMGENRLRNWISKPEYHPITFTFEEEGMLVSHVEVVWKMLGHNGVSYKAYGVSGVFTYPQFRKQGYAEQLVASAKEYMLKQPDVDIIFFTTCLLQFYEKIGFERMEHVIVHEGDPKNPTKTTDVAYMLFLSEKGKQGRKSFEETPVYFGEDLW